MILLSADKHHIYVSTNGGSNWHSHLLPGVAQDLMLSSVNDAHMTLVTLIGNVWNSFKYL